MSLAGNGRAVLARSLANGTAPRKSEGIVLLDSDLEVIGYDNGAEAILSDGHIRAVDDSSIDVPPEVLEALRADGSADVPYPSIRVCIGKNIYRCCTHIARLREFGLITVLHFSRDFSMEDAVLTISAEYRLTFREQQALRGVMAGLSSKEVAKQMQISPNTVKAFLRLIMGKMRVTSRAGIVAKLFEPTEYT